MSYDLMVFDPELAPHEPDAFQAWYCGVTAAEPSATEAEEAPGSAALLAWFHEFTLAYPPMTGPIANADPDNPKVTDYDLGRGYIYCSFAWSQAGEALRAAAELARKHEVGLYALSDRGEPVWRPVRPGYLEVFYCLNGHGESVPSELPITILPRDIADKLLPRVDSDSDFVGLVDQAGTTLQFTYEAGQNRFWIEIPSPERRGSYGTHLSRQSLGSMLSKLPTLFSLDAFPDFRFEPW